MGNKLAIFSIWYLILFSFQELWFYCITWDEPFNLQSIASKSLPYCWLSEIIAETVIACYLIWVITVKDSDWFRTEVGSICII